jgi:large subunit ribosomal protein L9
MKVILTQDIKDQGKKGAVINVSDGYARNYLFPRKLAIEADAAALSELKNHETAQKYKADTEKRNAEELAEKLKSVVLKISNTSGLDGRLYGAVTSKDIADNLKKHFDIDVDKRKINIDEPIKHFGTYVITVKLHPEITGSISVVVYDEKQIK